MSTIGDYIHLRRDTYLQIQDNPYKKTTLFSQYNRTKQAALNRFNSIPGNIKLAEDLEKALNTLFPTTDTALTNEDDKFRQQILKDIADSLNQAPKKISQILNASLEIGTAQSIDNAALEKEILERKQKLNEIQSILKDMKTRMKEEKTNRYGWEKDIVGILKGIKKIEFLNSNNDISAEEKKIIAQKNESLSDIANKINSLLTEVKGKSVNSKKNNIVVSQVARRKNNSLTIEANGITYKITRKKLEDTIDMITNYLNVDAMVTKDIGDGAEYGLGAIARACKLDRDEKIKKAMKDYIFGDKSTSIYFDVGNFNSNLSFLGEVETQTQSGKRKLYTAIKDSITEEIKGYKSKSSSQDKIDVIYESEDINAILQTIKKSYTGEELMLLSVKNYSKGSSFGGVSGTSFLSLVQSIPRDFVNHWINLTIGHQSKNDSSQFDFVSEEKPNDVKEAHLIMQRYLIKLGAAGGALKINNSKKNPHFIQQAQYIVWNDRSGQDLETWHVYPISLILSGVMKMEDLTTYVKGYNKFIQPRGDNGSWITSIDNEQDEITEQMMNKRIDNILKFMWEQKITTETPVMKALTKVYK